MFGKKKKQAQLEAERQQQEALKQQQVAPAEAPAPVQEEAKEALPKEYESIAYILKQETGEDLMALPVGESDDEIADIDLEELPELEELIEEPVEEVEEVEEEQAQIPVAPVQPAQAEQEEEVVYVVDGPTEDDDEIVKPAKLVKLPNLVDYMLSQNMSKKMKINIATLLLTAYNKYKNIPEEKKIVIQCMTKVMRSLVQDSQN